MCLCDYVLVLLYLCVHVLVSQGLFLLLLALGGAVCDVVEAGSDPRQVKQRPRRLLHLLVVALRRLLHRCRRTPLLQRQRVANAPHPSVFGPGQTAPRQRHHPSPRPCPRTTSLSAQQGLLGNIGSGGCGDMRIQGDLPGLGFDVRLDLHGDDVVVVQRGGRGGDLGGAQPAGGFGRAVSVVVLEVLAAGRRRVAGWAVLSSA